MAAPKYDYTSDYYDLFRNSSRCSAKVIMPFLFDLLHPRSILDVGCGLGSWLRVALDNRIDDVLGIDGDWVAGEHLEIPNNCFRSALLGDDFDLGRSFDLAMCLEVAEHLPAECGTQLIDMLVRHAPTVLFSAAVPSQGGDGHVNEARASHWRAVFAERGYACFDPIRKEFWSNRAIDVWYRQNMRLFVSNNLLAKRPDLRARLVGFAPMIDDVVHPELFEERSFRSFKEIEKLTRWAESLEKNLHKYQAFPPIALARRLRQMIFKIKKIYK